MTVLKWVHKRQFNISQWTRMICRLDINTFIEISKSTMALAEGMALMFNASWSNVIFKEFKLRIVLYLYKKGIFSHVQQWPCYDYALNIPTIIWCSSPPKVNPYIYIAFQKNVVHHTSHVTHLWQGALKLRLGITPFLSLTKTWVIFYCSEYQCFTEIYNYLLLFHFMSYICVLCLWQHPTHRRMSPKINFIPILTKMPKLNCKIIDCVSFLLFYLHRQAFLSPWQQHPDVLASLLFSIVHITCC